MGFPYLNPLARTCIWWGLAAGVLLTAVELALPAYRKWLPSPIGVGLGFILPFFNPFSMLLGALLAWLWSRRSQQNAERYAVPVASGIIAGESIVSVIIALLNNLLLR
jgi:uncharacterized oligopeptide transporter (OPT) family protein